jgi:protein-tyrosine phosphatase
MSAPGNEELLARARIRIAENIRLVAPGVYQGAAFPSSYAPLVAEIGIDSVLDLRDEGEHDLAKLSSSGLRYNHLPIAESRAPSQVALARAVRWVTDERASGHNVLVHCRFGVSRSTVVACAILIAMGETFDSACLRIRELRPGSLERPDHLAALEMFARPTPT